MITYNIGAIIRNMSLRAVEAHSRAASVCATFASGHLRGVTGIAECVHLVESNPSILQPALDGIDGAVVEFNNLLQQRENPHASQQALLPNSHLLRRFRRSSTALIPLPTVEELTGFKDGRCSTAFKNAKILMLAGEHEETPGWSFQKNMTNPDQLIDAFALELYGLRVFPDQASLLVRALEEMLAVHHPDSRMVDSIRQFYTPEEGFSPILVDLVNGRIPDDLANNPQVMQSTHYRIETCGGKIIIVPITGAAKSKLDRFADSHGEECVPRIVQGLDDRHRLDYVITPSASVDLTPRHLLQALGAGRLSIAGLEINLTIR